MCLNFGSMAAGWLRGKISNTIFLSVFIFLFIKSSHFISFVYSPLMSENLLSLLSFFITGWTYTYTHTLTNVHTQVFSWKYCLFSSYILYFLSSLFFSLQCRNIREEICIEKYPHSYKQCIFFLITISINVM